MTTNGLSHICNQNSSIHYYFFGREGGREGRDTLVANAIRQMLQTYGATFHSMPLGHPHRFICRQLVTSFGIYMCVCVSVCLNVWDILSLSVCRISFISFITMFLFWNDQNETFVVFLVSLHHAQLKHIIRGRSYRIGGKHTSSNCNNNFNALHPI